MKESSSKVTEESLSMTACRLLQNTSFMQKDTGLYRWWTQLCRDYVSSGQHPMLGMFRIIMTSVDGEKSDRTLRIECVSCGKSSRRLMTNLSKSMGLCDCSGRKYQDKEAAKILGYRYEAMVQRCRRDTHVSSPNYKGRGIEVKMTREEFILWALEKWPNREYLALDFDRIENDGHYELGNLQLSTRSENLRNTRRSAHSMVRAAQNLLQRNPDVAYTEKTVWNKLQAGMTEQEILAEASANAHLCGAGKKPNSALGRAQQWLADHPEVEFCHRYVAHLWRKGKYPLLEWRRRQRKLMQGVEGRVRQMLKDNPHLTYAPKYLSKLLERGETEALILEKHKRRKAWTRRSGSSVKSASTTS